MRVGEQAGVWVAYVQDMGATDVRPYAAEIDALRAINERGYGSVIFVPFGSTADESHAAQRPRPLPDGVQDGAE